MPFTNIKQQTKKQAKQQAKKQAKKQAAKPKPKPKQQLKQSAKLLNTAAESSTMTVEIDQLRAALAIQAEHMRVRAMVVEDQAREIAELKAARAEKDRINSGLYDRLTAQAEVSVQRFVQISALEGEVDKWKNECEEALDLYFSAEAGCRMYKAYTMRDANTMAVLNGECQDPAVKADVEQRINIAMDEHANFLADVKLVREEGMLRPISQIRE